jgi:phosphoglycolate phosphatase-like HAD superfamily hydrolase
MPDAAAIFDVDGVLLELTQQEEDAFFHPFESIHGLTGLSRDWDSYRIRNDEDIITEILERHFGRTPETHELRHLIDAYTRHVTQGVQDGGFVPVRIEGAHDLLKTLNGHLALGIATANLLDVAKVRLTATGLWDLVAAHPHGADGGGAKRDVLARAIAATGLPRERIVFVGDNLNDVDAGLANGVHFIGFSRDPARRARLAAGGAPVTCANHSETLKQIKRLLALDAMAMSPAL